MKVTIDGVDFTEFKFYGKTATSFKETQEESYPTAQAIVPGQVTPYMLKDVQ